MLRSLYSGVSGLRTHQTRMDVIGNNIANVNTTAYKSMSINFSDLMYQTTQSATGPNAQTGVAGTNPRQIGLGVQTAAISTKITEEGATQSTGNPFDLKISGDEFFVVSDGVNTYFTRDGSFYVDAAGNLAMSSTGYNVMGWQVDEETGNIKKDTVSPLVVMSEDNMTYPAEWTQAASASGIVDWFDDDQSSKAGKVMNLQIYDNLGYSYTVKMSLHNATKGEGTDPYKFYTQIDDILDSNGDSILKGDLSKIKYGTTQSVNLNGESYGVNGYDVKTKEISITVGGNTTTTTCAYVNYDDGNSTTSVILYPTGDLTGATGLTGTETKLFSATGTVTDNDIFEGIYGKSIDPANILGGTVDPKSGTLTVTNKNITGVVLTYSGEDGTLQSPKEDSTVLDLTGLGDAFSKIKIDFSKTVVSDNKGKSTAQIEKGSLKDLESGRSLGTLQGVSIQTNGMIYASYTNGQKKLLGQIAVAEFANASGLQKEGDNLYSSTQNSGDFDGIGVDISANGDKMNTGVLEMSNVDLSSEFTDMITTQRGFQANSRTITVSDTLLEELINLKR